MRPSEHHVPLTSLARELHLRPRTLQRWIARYGRTRLSGARAYVASRSGQRRLRSGLREAIAGLGLQRPRTSATNCGATGVEWVRARRR
ncbi:MAG: hypothetical protein JOZ65_35395 [Chloroflexi bacterium]|nr:hypothetical protein [Chloroflexota bacterium]